MKFKNPCCLLLLFLYTMQLRAQEDLAAKIDQHTYDPSTLMWGKKAAANWNEAYPVGNGRLAAMVYGRPNSEDIQLNEDTYWSGGPYSSVVKGGYKYLPQVRDLVNKGQFKDAQTLFGRKLMGYPVEQQKYQPLANLMLFFKPMTDVTDYKRWLDLQTGITSVQFSSNGVTYRRDVFSSAADQVIAVRITASKPGCISLTASLRGVRNQQESNYATDYFKMDGLGNDALVLTGKSADYLGVPGTLRYDARLKAVPDGGTMHVTGADLVIENADAVTLYFAAATNFVNYRDVSADENAKAEAYIKAITSKTYQTIKQDHLTDYQKLFARVSLNLGVTANSWLPTNERLANSAAAPDPQLAALAYQFGRYLLISSSRPGTQAANLQGIWNNDSNPAWDSKYTTNINLQMNYWAVESANLSECAEPLIRLMKEVTDQGAQVARENYNCRGWVLHQNTDLWRVAAPMDGPTWGTFTTAGAWLCDALWDHYQYTGDKKYLADIYPVIKGSVDFFMDYLVKDPSGKWLVTNPSSSPENFTGNPGNGPYFDEVTGSMLPGTTICAGSSIDMQIITDLFTNYIKAAKILGVDGAYALKVASAKNQLRPQLIGRDGALQEWTEDWPQLEKQHRHSSPLYGLYPGNVFSIKNTPAFVDACKAVLNQRGDGTSGWSRVWKAALWARLNDGNRANSILKGYFKEEVYTQLFAKCSERMQVDGSMGVTAAISEMLVRSNNGVIELLPALPDEWADGEFKGVCTTGAFELDLKWQKGKIIQVKVLSKQGQVCHISPGVPVTVTANGKKVRFEKLKDGSIKFATDPGETYVLRVAAH
ncbi:glycoside hydrolase N-terminal domain-containing protein [Mucilaginibacter sp. BJC16-A38]|uniref:glycoside hydrolase family 95 protein n=1 Tax=Mucilaginibacter phenanthrenivorans TaxID=1234842 RepID=UPI0021580771|nr:glycoside hydrolase N-terminal domain-containing protein [Mucilaginibacter phenanthrenivorans]MCR8560897.1 glycoside hydrolase N-terminal domain-containing protein [Mucilaginibacter phenanthrenivorans]